MRRARYHACMSADIHHRFVDANGVRFHIAECGEGAPVLLLHGFPECWYSWRHALPALAAAGYHAVAPDMRGYNLTDKPPSGYDAATLVADVAALAGELWGAGALPALVGHDWGGIVAWQAAARRPELFSSLVIMNAPHPAAFSGYLLRHPTQMLRSWYMLFFQLPALPEHLLTRDRARAIAEGLRRSAADPAAFSDEDLEVYREAFLRPGAAKASINYYREAVRGGPGALPRNPVELPVLVLWGAKDPALEEGLLEGLERWAPRISTKLLPGVGHWTQQEAPDVVHKELVDWFGAWPPARAAGPGLL